MTRRSPYLIELSAADRAALEQRARAYTAPYHQVMRAKIVLLAAEGRENTVIAARLDITAQLVSKRRKRFFEEGLDGLKDRPRTGRPLAHLLAVVTVKALACELPAETGMPGSAGAPRTWRWRPWRAGWWSRSRRRRCAAGLAADALKPWQHRSWIYPLDPTSPRRRPERWTSTPGSGMANPWARTSSWSARMRRPRSRLGVAATPHCPRGRPG